MDLRDRRESEIRFLQPHAARLEEDHGARRDAVAVVFGGEFERAGDLGAADLAHAAALKRAFDASTTAGWPSILPFATTTPSSACVTTPCRASQGERHALERVEQFAKRAGVEQRVRAAARIELDEAVALEQAAVYP